MPADQANFFSGMITMGFAACAAFFLRLWARAKDSLFLAVALAFLLLCLNQALSSILGAPSEEGGWLALLRLAAFVLVFIVLLRRAVSK